MTNKFLDILGDIWGIGIIIIFMPLLILIDLISSRSKNPNFKVLLEENKKEIIGNE